MPEPMVKYAHEKARLKRHLKGQMVYLHMGALVCIGMVVAGHDLTGDNRILSLIYLALTPFALGYCVWQAFRSRAIARKAESALDAAFAALSHAAGAARTDASGRSGQISPA